MTAAIKSAPLGRVDRKIALLRYVERLPLPDIAAQTHYSRTAIGYRLKSIDEMLNCQVAKRQSVDTPGFYADMAKAFLEDADAADGKAYLYWDCIADK